MIDKSPSERYIALATVIIAIFAFLIINAIRHKGCEGLGCLDFPTIGNYRIDEIYQSDENSFRGMYVNGSDKLRLNVEKNIKNENAKEEISIMMTRMNKLYEKERSPYPGEISDKVVCADEFIPKWRTKSVNGNEINYTTAYLNDRLVYGACTEDQLKYRSLLATFYCSDQKKLYQLEIITDKNSFSREIDDFVSKIDDLECR